MIPIKFQYKQYEAEEKDNEINGEGTAQSKADAVLKKRLMKREFFIENPNLIEFAKRNQKESETPNTEEAKKKAAKLAKQIKANKKKKHEDSKLVWGRPNFGIFDRYGAGKSNLDQCYLYSGPGNDKGIPQIG